MHDAECIDGFAKVDINPNFKKRSVGVDFVLSFCNQLKLQFIGNMSMPIDAELLATSVVYDINVVILIRCDLLLAANSRPKIVKYFPHASCRGM